MKRTIPVTQSDIDSGKPENLEACPIAHAIRRVVRDGIPVQVYSDWVSLAFPSRNPSSLGRYERFTVDVLPEIAVDFIRRFDARQPVAPFAFDLDLPEEVLR